MDSARQTELGEVGALAGVRFDLVCRLHTRICDALRGAGPGVEAKTFTADGEMQLLLSDGHFSIRERADAETGNPIEYLTFRHAARHRRAWRPVQSDSDLTFLVLLAVEGHPNRCGRLSSFAMILF
jgi:hypothetical protein